MQAIHENQFRSALRRATRATAWVSALALAGGLVAAAPLTPVRPTAAQVPPPPSSLPAGSAWRLTSNWNPPGADVRNVLFVTGDNAPKGAIDDEGVALTNQAFIGYWQAEGDNAEITNPDPRLAAGFAQLTGDAANNGTRMSAVDSGRYAGTRDYLGNGATLYVWSNDSYDFFKSDAGHPAEFTDAMLGTRPGTKTVCRPSNWGDANRGSWVSVVSYALDSRDGQAFWVPNPRSADVMSAYDSDSGGPNDYPGYYPAPRDPAWPCGSSGNWDDGWGGGEVVQSTGEIFFGSRQSSSMTQTYRAMIFNPKTGAFASSGLLQPNDPTDAIFAGSDAQVVGDLMIDGNANGYVIVEGRAPAGSIWHDPYDTSAGGGQRAYIVRIVPTPNPAWDPADPQSMRYLHNAGWKYNIVQRVYSDPSAPSNSDVFRVFGKLGAQNNTAANNLKGSDWYNGDLYANNNRYLYRIDPTSGRADTVPASGNDLMEGFRESNVSTSAITPRDMASGQESLTVSGVVFHDVNGNGLRDPGDDGLPGVQVVLYEDRDNDGVWQQRSDTGLHTTDAQGNYTFFLGQNSRYQVRVFSPVIDGRQARQTAASYGWGDAGQGRNEVDAHCHDAPDGLRGNDEGDEITSIGDTNPPQPCAGAVPPPFTDPALPPVADSLDDPSYQLDNRDGRQVPFYSTIIVNAPTRIPNADFGFNADPPDTRCYPDRSSLAVTPAGPIPAGQGYRVTVTARDKAGALCTTATDVTFSADPAGPTFNPAGCTTDPATGQCSTTVTSTTAGTYQLHAWMPDPANNQRPTDVQGNGDPAGASPQPRTWTAEPAAPVVDPDLSWYHAVAADGHLPVYVLQDYTVSVYVRDTADRPMADVTVTLAATPAAAFTPTACHTDTSGRCAVTMTTTASHQAGLYAIAAVADGTTINPNTDRTRLGHDGTSGWQRGETDARGFHYDAPAAPVVKFWGGPDLGHARVTVAPDHQTAGSPVKVTIEARDAYDNPVEDLVEADLTVAGSPVAPTANPALAPLPHSFDGSRRATGQYSFSLTSQQAGEFKLTGSGRGQEIADRPGVDNHPHVWFVPGAVCPQCSTLVVTPSPAAGPITAGDSYTATVTALDSGGRAIAGVPVSWEIVPLPGTTPRYPAELSAAACTTGADGTCQITVSATTAGEYSLHARLPDPLAAGQLTDVGGGGDPAQASPQKLTWAPGPQITITQPTPRLITNADPISVRGTSSTPGDTVRVDDGHGHTCATTVQADHSWTCPLAEVPEGVITITATATDTAGRSATDQVDITVDRTPPGIIPDLNDPSHIGIETEPNANVSIQDAGGQTICAAQADDTGHAVCVPAPGHVPQPGDRLLFFATDQAGNQSSRPARVVVVEVSDPNVVLPGENKETIVGHYFQPGEKAHAVIDGGEVDLGWAIADDQGDVTFVWTVPGQGALGGHTATIQGETSGNGSAGFTVSLAPPLPVTGTHASADLAGDGLLVMTLGLGLALLGRRQRLSQ